MEKCASHNRLFAVQRLVFLTMEHQNKRALTQAIRPQEQDPYIASLSTIGMRIRKAVAEGYSVQSPASYKADSAPAYAISFDVNGGLNNSSAMRIPLPEGMSQPPSLTSSGSTFQSGLNVSEWGQPVNVVSIPSIMGTKRRYDQDESITIEQPSLEEYNARYGRLSFNEDF